MAVDPVRVSASRPEPGAAGARLAALYDAHGRMVYGVCRLLLRDRHEAEDAAQQTFLSAHRSLLAGTDPRDPAAWLGTIARNECRVRVRARMREPLGLPEEAEHPSGGPESELARREEMAALYDAIRELPEAQRDAVLLRDFYGLSYGEVGAALGVSGPAVESLLFRARRRLQDRLRPLRSAAAGVVVPAAVRDALAESVPGFGGGGAAAAVGAGAGGFGALAAKLAAAPLAAKLAAAALAVGAGTAVGVAETTGSQPAELVPPAFAAVREPQPEAPPAERVDQAAPRASAPLDSHAAADDAAQDGDSRGPGGGAGQDDDRDDGDGHGPSGDDASSGSGPVEAAFAGEGGSGPSGPGRGSEAEGDDRSGPGGGETDADGDRSGPGGDADEGSHEGDDLHEAGDGAEASFSSSGSSSSSGPGSGEEPADEEGSHEDSSGSGSGGEKGESSGEGSGEPDGEPGG
jgi:RNA polymerase sigma-70 factor (ECF subfamily)